ncbi:MAG TPA: phosphatidylglycerophosphatase A [Bacteriovoracaceae bacterium]|nr:phosphatidylglycerophosphatase A [Bacteriovoracaceae bacterium]
MKDQKLNAFDRVLILLLSWFYSGKFPKFPGTIGSLATLPFIYLLSYYQVNIYTLLLIITTLFIFAVSATQYLQVKFATHDPQWIVLDEVIGMLITWAFIMKVDPASLFLVFFMFRFFDIIKFWPATYFDRMAHGFGTIFDDVVSAVYAGICCYIVQYFFGPPA